LAAARRGAGMVTAGWVAAPAMEVVAANKAATGVAVKEGVPAMVRVAKTGAVAVAA